VHPVKVGVRYRSGVGEKSSYDLVFACARHICEGRRATTRDCPYEIRAKRVGQDSGHRSKSTAMEVPSMGVRHNCFGVGREGARIVLAPARDMMVMAGGRPQGIAPKGAGIGCEWDSGR